MNIFKEYVNYLRDNPHGYWFKKKIYGFGWTPVTWQGWLITLAYAALVLIFILAMNNVSVNREIMFTSIIPIAFLTYIFILITYKKGEKPGWQWGLKKK